MFQRLTRRRLPCARDGRDVGLRPGRVAGSFAVIPGVDRDADHAASGEFDEQPAKLPLVAARAMQHDDGRKSSDRFRGPDQQDRHALERPSALRSLAMVRYSATNPLASVSVFCLSGSSGTRGRSSIFKKAAFTSAAGG